MKKKKDRSMLYAALVGFVLCMLPVLTVMVLISRPSDLGDRLPPGTQIIQNTDTHRGVFRHQGVATLVARIPPEDRESFGEMLQEREDFWEGSAHDYIREVVKNVEGLEETMDSEHTLCIYGEQITSLFKTPLTDWFAAAYDQETGLFCCVEYDN